jgi:hypothetical protein
LIQLLLKTVARGLFVMGLVYILVALTDVAVFRMPTRERSREESAFRSQCQSLRPGFTLGQVESAFGSSSLEFSIERRNEIVKIQHGSIVCTLALAPGSNSVASATLGVSAEGVDWKQ